MSWPGRLWAGDEELGKKDDDHRPSNGVSQSTAWSVRKPQALPRRRRIIYALCAALFLYLFIKNIPTDLGSNALRADSRVYQPPKSPQESTILPSPGKITPPSSGKKPPRPKTPSEAQEHYHDGPIKFYKLAASLHAVAKLGGQKENNKNVLFAASNLKSVSELLPLACEMARFERNDVHIAIMGRGEIEIQEIRAINGISDDCTVHWHGKYNSPTILTVSSSSVYYRCTSRLLSMELRVSYGSKRDSKLGAYPDVHTSSSDHSRRSRQRRRRFYYSFEK